MRNQIDSASPDRWQVNLECFRDECFKCHRNATADYENFRTINTMKARLHLRLQIRRCHNRSCRQKSKPYRPEFEGRLALPRANYGFDVLARVGGLRHHRQFSVSQIHHYLTERAVPISQRTVTNLVGVYERLISLSLRHDARLKSIVRRQGEVFPDIFIVPTVREWPDLLIVRDRLCNKILLAKEVRMPHDVRTQSLIMQVVRQHEKKEQIEPEQLAELLSDFRKSIQVPMNYATYGCRRLMEPVRATFSYVRYRPYRIHG
jgi:hypothetical protein